MAWNTKSLPDLTCVLFESLDDVYSDKTLKFAFSQESQVYKQIDHIEMHIAVLHTLLAQEIIK